jgi:tetratricopeptide (TPR) repeat protein
LNRSTGISSKSDLKNLHKKALSLQKDGNQEDAIKYFDKSLKIEPNNFGAFINKGLCLSSPNMNRQEDAILCFEQALILVPNDPGALSLRIRIR